MKDEFNGISMIPFVVLVKLFMFKTENDDIECLR